MKYKWDLNELRNNQKTLENLYNSVEDDLKKQEILAFINLYKSMIDLVIKKEKKENYLLNDDIEETNIKDLIENQIYEYQTTDISLLNSIIQSYIPFKSVHPIDFELREIPVITTNEEIITITKDFFHKMTPPYIEKNFLSILNSKGIHFDYSKENNGYSGITLLDTILKNKYIYILRNNLLIDLVTLPHESFHNIMLDYKHDIATNFNTYYTFEIEGGFANILFGDYFYKNAIQHKNFFNEYFVEIFNSNLTSIVVRNSFLESVTEKNHFRLNKFNKMISTYGIETFSEESEILDFMITPLDIDMKYSLAFLTAIDLYYIYQKDPDLAFYLLKNIRYITHENDVLGLLRRNHITFMDDDYKNLKQYIKKIESQK